MATTTSSPSESNVPESQSAQQVLTDADFSEFSQDIFAGMRRLHAGHNDLAVLQHGSQRIVLLFSPELNQQVLSDPETYHARFFTIRGPRRSAQRRLTCGLLAMNGAQHRRNRRLLKVPFGLKTIATYGDTITRLTDEMLDNWQTGSVLDLADEMRRFMLRLTSSLLFGFERPEQAYRLGDMISEWVTMNHRVGAGALMPDDTFSDHYEDLLSFADLLEAEVMQMIVQCRAARESRNDVLSILVRTHDEEGGLSDEELVGQSAVLFAAAHMTTAHSLTSTLLLLAQHPAVMHQLWEEDSATSDSEDAPSGNVGGEAGRLIDRVIKESMRVLPASAYSQRVNMKAVRLGSLDLPRGTGIVFTPLVIHHLDRLYDEPQRFDPDRWLQLKPSPYEYIPFGAGPRMCIGAPLAMAILRTVLPRIMQRFRLRVVPNSVVNLQVESTMLAPVGEVPVEIHPADGAFESSPISGNLLELVDMPTTDVAAPNRPR